MQNQVKKKKQLSFPNLLKNFLGYLEGTQKSSHTIASYRLDLLAFGRFFETSPTLGKKGRDWESLDLTDLEAYRTHLISKGLKANTRRRRLLTVSRWIQYLTRRKKFPLELDRKILLPHKMERIPLTVSSPELIQKIRALPVSGDSKGDGGLTQVRVILEERNRLLLWTLAESGCLVSEVGLLRFSDWVQKRKQGFFVRLGEGGKSGEKSSRREVPISSDLYEAVSLLFSEKSQNPGDWVFFGFNKMGPLSAPISSRGVELLVRSYSRLLGEPRLVPKTFRYSILLHWLLSGVSQNEARERLGLKSDSIFRVFLPLVEAKRKTLVAGAGHDPTTFAL